MKTHLISHIFNEESLLPYWLSYHSKIFDNIIIIDYNSTDNSVNVCRQICPDITIIPSRNSNFSAANVDKEVMDIESTLDGIKMVLNITEFLICKTNIATLFEQYNNNKVSLSVQAFTAYSKRDHVITDLMTDLLEPDMVFLYERGNRQIHNYPTGAYTVGRHTTRNREVSTNEFYIMHFGNYPMNESTIQRKQQIAPRIPESDKRSGLGYHHFWNREKFLAVNNNGINIGKTLKQLNPFLFDIIMDKIKKP
jgi:hypothetical protein